MAYKLRIIDGRTKKQKFATKFIRFIPHRSGTNPTGQLNKIKNKIKTNGGLKKKHPTE